MRVYNYTYGKKIDGRRVIALGLFDGVHLGHRALIDAARGLARRLGTHLSVFTFSSEDALPKGGARIYSTERKLEILESLDVDEVIITDFSSVSLLYDKFVTAFGKAISDRIFYENAHGFFGI